MHQELSLAGFQLSLVGYARLSNALALTFFLDRIGVDRNSTGTSSSMLDFFCNIKKPGRKCRLFLSSCRAQPLENLTTCVTFFRLIGTDYIGNKNFETNISWWNLSFLPNRIRTFAFKFYNNILGLNTRTAHFIVNPNRSCTFCSLGYGTVTDETFIHLFFDCPTTRRGGIMNF